MALFLKYLLFGRSQRRANIFLLGLLSTLRPAGPIAAGKDHVTAISCPHKWHSCHQLWHKNRASCGNVSICRTAAGDLTSGLQLVRPCCRHYGGIHKSSALFPGVCTDGSPMGKIKTPLIWNIFRSSLLPLTLTYTVQLLKNTCTDVHTCLCSGAQWELSTILLRTQAVDTHPLAPAMPYCPDSKGLHPKFHLLFFVSSCCVENSTISSLEQGLSFHPSSVQHQPFWHLCPCLELLCIMQNVNTKKTTKCCLSALFLCASSRVFWGCLCL